MNNFLCSKSVVVQAFWRSSNDKMWTLNPLLDIWTTNKGQQFYLLRKNATQMTITFLWNIPLIFFYLNLMSYINVLY